MSFLLCDLEIFFTRSAFLDSGIVELKINVSPFKGDSEGNEEIL